MAYYEGNTGADLNQAAEIFKLAGLQAGGTPNSDMCATLHMGENLMKEAEAAPSRDIKPDMGPDL